MSDTTQPLIINDDSKIDNNIMISTNLYTAIVPAYNAAFHEQPVETGEIITTGYAKTPSNGGYIQLPYISPAGSVKPNATYVNGTTVKNYKTSNIYIFKPSHVIENTTYDAEMVVEMVPTTNPGEKLYLCFLLKSYRDAKQPINDIDKIIINSNKIDYYKTNHFNLQTHIENAQKKIIYTNNIDTVIVFTKPIAIKEYDFSNYLPINMFSTSPSDYKLIRIITQEGFKEGANGSARPEKGKTAVLTCTPINTGEKEENDNELVVMNTEGGNNMMSVSIMSGILTTLIVTFICIFAVPPLYFISMNNVNLNTSEKMLYSIIIAGSLLILGFSLLLDKKGKQLDPYSEPMAGFVIITIVGLSFCGINMNSQKLLDLGMVRSNFRIAEGIDSMINKISKGKNPGFLIIGTICILIFLVGFVEGAVKKNKIKTMKNKSAEYKKHVGNLIEGIGITYGFLFLAIFICFLTDNSR